MTAHTQPPVLRARAVHKSFGKNHALRGADLDIDAGSMVAIMGPSGSGKSTLLHCLAGVLAPDSGSIWFHDRQISDLGEAERSALRLAHFGFVFQFGQLLPELSALDNVMVPLLLRKIPRGRAARVAADWLERLQIRHLADQLPGLLSGGEAQRVAIARAMAGQPKVLFADEPTGSLDSLAAENVMAQLTQLARGSGTTVVLSTHDARTAAYADRTVIVRDGAIATGLVSGARR